MYSVKGRVGTSSAAVIVAMRRALLPLVVASCALLSLSFSFPPRVERRRRERTVVVVVLFDLFCPEDKKSSPPSVSRSAAFLRLKHLSLLLFKKKRGKFVPSNVIFDTSTPSFDNTIKIDTRQETKKTPECLVRHARVRKVRRQ